MSAKEVEREVATARMFLEVKVKKSKEEIEDILWKKISAVVAISTKGEKGDTFPITILEDGRVLVDALSRFSIEPSAVVELTSSKEYQSSLDLKNSTYTLRKNFESEEKKITYYLYLHKGDVKKVFTIIGDPEEKPEAGAEALPESLLTLYQRLTKLLKDHAHTAKRVRLHIKEVELGDYTTLPLDVPKLLEAFSAIS